MMIRISTAVKTDEGRLAQGQEAAINLDSIAAVEPRLNRYHSFRQPQKYAVVHLMSGAQIDVLADAESILSAINEAALQRDGCVIET